MGWPIVIVDSGGIPVTEAANRLGAPVTVAMNGFGTAVTYVTSGGIPVRGALLLLSNQAVDDSASAGTVVGALSVVNTGAGPWTFSLLDDAGGRFAVSGSNLVVGSTPLDHDTMPTPSIQVRASDGSRNIDATFVMNVRKPLPALPLSAGSRLALIGHSQMGYANYGGVPVPVADASVGTLPYGIFAMAHHLDPRFNMDSWYDASDPASRNFVGANLGIFGAHFDAISAQMDAILARKPQAVAIMGATNTISTGDAADPTGSAAYCIAVAESILQRARNAGLPAILMADYPRGQWVAGAGTTVAQKNAALAAYRDWVLAQAGRDGVQIVDLWDLLAPGGVQDAALFQSDLTHLSPKGAGLAAAKTGAGSLSAALQAVFGAGEQFSTDPTTADQLVAAANYNFAATGAASGTGLSGTKATSIFVATTPPASGSTAVFSMEAIGATGRNKQVIDITPANNGTGTAYHTLTMQLANSAITGVAAGDWIRTSIIVEVEGANLGMFRYRPEVDQVSTARAKAILMAGFSTDFPGQIPAGVYKLVSPPMQVPAQTFDRFRSFLDFYWSRTRTGAFRVKFHSYKWAKITDPRTAWGY